MSYLIIGNSAAAVGAIETIRQNDQKEEIIVVSKEPYHVYSRPLISYYLAREVDTKQMFYREKNFYKNNKVQTILGKKATGIELEKRRVILEDGEQISYGKLLIATGGSPFIPPIEGSWKEGVYTFTTWDDAKAIAEAAKRAKKAVVIGGGMIGLKATESLVMLGIDTTVIELAERVLSLSLDEKGSYLMQKHLKKKGVKVITGNTVAEIVGRAKVAGVRLKDGRQLDCNLVVVAIGVVPNTELVDGLSMKVNRGIAVDDKMQTNVPNIYAAGDVAEAKEVLSGEKRVIPIWPIAYNHGSVAGSNMTGNEMVFQGGLSMNSIEVLGLPTISVGITNPPDGNFKILTKYDAPKMIYKKVVLRDDIIVGSVFVNAIDRAGIITDLIKNKVNVKSFKSTLLNDDFGYVFFPEEERLARLGA